MRYITARVYFVIVYLFMCDRHVKKFWSLPAQEDASRMDFFVKDAGRQIICNIYSAQKWDGCGVEYCISYNER